MAFAQPLALLFFLLFLPIVLLYLLRQRRRRVQVSTLMFWDQVLRDEQTVASFTRLRKLLSLLLQLLFIALLALALARPVFSKDLLGARRIVVLLDTSASMGVREKDGTRLEEAKREAGDIVRGLASGDSMMLVTVAHRPDIAVPFTDSRRELTEALNRIELTHTAGRLEGVVDLLRNLPADPRDIWVYLIGDGAFEPIETDLPRGMQFAYLRTGEAEENVGITSFELRRLPASPRDFEILFEATNETGQEVRLPYELRVEGALIDAGELHLPPGERRTKSVRQFSQAGGEVRLTLDYKDAFPVDNVAYAVVRSPEAIPVGLVTDGNLFLESALATDDQIALQTVAPSDYPPRRNDVSRNPVFVFDRWSPAEEPKANSVYIGAWPPQLGIPSNGDLINPVVTEWAHDHTVTRHLELSNVMVRKAIKFAPTEGFETLVRSFDDPLVALADRGETKSLVLAFDPADSDLPLRVAFPMLIGNAVRYLAGQAVEDGWRDPTMGQVLSPKELIARLHRQAVHGGVTVERVLRPSERSNETAANAGEAASLRPVPVDRAGVYAAQLSDGTTIPLFAANLNSRSESRIRPAEEPPLKTAKPTTEVRQGIRLGTEPWLLLVVLAFALSLVEWFLFHRRWVE